MERVKDIGQQQGSIADVADRLTVWATRAPKGLARVEYVSDLSRQRVVNELRRRMAAEGVAFHEIHLPSGMSPSELARHFVKRLRSLGAGIVSVTGFAAALPDKDPARGEALYALNFNREEMTRFPLRQIWWVPGHVADLFVRALPDLNSWFLVKLRLTEVVPPIRLDGETAWLRPGQYTSSLEDGRKRAAALADQLSAAIEQGLPVEEIVEKIAVPAIEALMEAGAEKEARELADRLADKLGPQARRLRDFTRLRQDLLEKALERVEAELGPDHPAVADHLNDLAASFYESARYNEAEPLFRRALEIDEASSGPNHPRVATALNNLGMLLKATNRLDEAEPLFRRALETDEVSFGPNHPSVAIRLNNLALLLKDTNRLDEAEPLFRRALEIAEASFGPDHPSVATDLNNLALLLKDTNRFDEAEPLFRRALELDEASFGPDHPDVATDLNNLASLLKATNRFDEAEPLLRRALEIVEKSFGPEHPHTKTTRNNLMLLERERRSKTK